MQECARSGCSSAFSADSLRTGAVISFDGDELVISGAGIVDAIESGVTDAASSLPRSDQWLAAHVPLLSRGDAWIVPMSWEPPRSSSYAPDRDVLARRVSELWMSARSRCWFGHGDQIGLDLTPDALRGNPYAAELVRTGTRSAVWWAFGQSAVVLVVHGDPLPAPPSLMAVHVVPVGWVSERRPLAPKKSRLDLGWSWEDAIALHRDGEAPGGTKHAR